MTHADSLPPAWDGSNVRDVPTTETSHWRRPHDAAVADYQQPWDDQLPEDIYRDGAWRAADAKDLVALALWGIPVVIALTAAALL